ncbi:MAG: metallophosphoesterase family protein [Bryobacterales bacterium]|nr:metallophosphoesterase family protein [Bryobacterales bacterium]
MRYLVLSDLHANWEALQAVLQHARGGYDAVLCCGDLVGYGADPNLVVQWARQHVAAVVRGNHDKACAGLEDLEWFNPVARAAALWTQRTLTADNRDYLRRLPKGPVPLDGFQILHGSPVDEDEYLVTVADVQDISSYVDRAVSFFGHTHVQGGFLWQRGGVRRVAKLPADEQERVLELPPDSVCLANPGAVGQPRDGDPRAAYLLYVPEERILIYRRVAYDLATAQRKILDAGLPPALAHRLTLGA